MYDYLHPQRHVSIQPRGGCWLILKLFAAWLLVTSGAAAKDSFMIKVRVKDRLLEGQPLHWSEREVMLLSRDGQLETFRPRDASDYRKSAPRFFSYSTGEIRTQLYEEFGKGFDVSGTGHYLVVHPKGKKNLWAQRFEDLYRSFFHYFKVRGFALSEPKVPLVAIVFERREDYHRYGQRTGAKLGPHTLGHYHNATNRVALFDLTRDRPNGDWSDNADTIIHEATHQTAFNTGVHTRFADVPRWLTEGLATMFESRGVWNSKRFHRQRDRINGGRLGDFRKFAATRRKTGNMIQLIASDRNFDADWQGAYAEAWALSFYLCETRPRLYSQYLRRTAAREPFSKYGAEERVADFQAVFGKELGMLEVQFLRYMQNLKG